MFLSKTGSALLRPAPVNGRQLVDAFFAKKKKRLSAGQAKRLKSWLLGAPLPLPLPKRQRKLTGSFPHVACPTTCWVCGVDHRTREALTHHYSRAHAVTDPRLVTIQSFSCARCGRSSGSPWGLRRHLCTRATLLRSREQRGLAALTAAKPPPLQWLIATDGSAVPERVETEFWGEVLLDDQDPRALGADSSSNNAGELWALAEAFLWLRDESGDNGCTPVTLVYDSMVAFGLVTESWALQTHRKLVGLS